MKSLKPLLLVGSLLLSSMAWAEGGSDRVFERIQQMRDKAEAVLIQAEKANHERPVRWGKSLLMAFLVGHHQLVLSNHLTQHVVYQLVMLFHPGQMLFGRHVWRGMFVVQLAHDVF